MYKLRFESTLRGNKDFDYLPENWQDIKSSYIRSEEYFGITQRIEDVSFQFISEQADYIRDCFYYAPFTEIIVIFYYSEDETEFKEFYTGLIDLKTFSDDAVKVSCRVVPSSLVMKFLNNLSSVYKIPTTQQIGIIGQQKDFTGAYTASDLTDLALYPNVDDRHIEWDNFYAVPTPSKWATFAIERATGNVDRFRSVVIPMFFAESDNDIETYTTWRNNGSALPFHVYTSRNNCDVTVSWDIDISLEDRISGVASSMLFELKFIYYGPNGEFYGEDREWKNLGNSHDAPPTWDPSGTNRWITANWTGSYTASFNKDAKLVILCCPKTNEANSLNYNLYNITGTLSIETEETSPNSWHKAELVGKMFEELTKKASDNTTMVLQTDIFALGQKYGYTIATNGIALRQDENATVNIETSIADLFRVLNIPFCLGMSADTKNDRVYLNINHRSQFFKPEQVIELGDVTDLVIEFDESYVFNEFLVNYPSVDNRDRDGGMLEYLTKYRYTLPSDFVDNTLDNSTDYKVDRTSVELQRERALGETDTNEAEDNTNFIVRAKANGEMMRHEDYTSVIITDGLQNVSQLFNLDFFAPMTLRFWAWWIYAGLQKYASDKTLTIQKSEQNQDIDLQITDEGITNNFDNNNIALSKLLSMSKMTDNIAPERNLFDPIIYRFNYPVRMQDLEIFKYGEKHGVVKFAYNNKYYYGFVLQFPAIPNRVGEFILLKLSQYGETLL